MGYFGVPLNCMCSTQCDVPVLPGCSLREPIDGYLKTIQKITRDDILEYHQTNYRPQDLVIVTAGNFEPQEIKKLAQEYFAAWEKSKQDIKANPPLPAPPLKIIRKHAFIKGKSQLDLVLGCYGPARTSPDYTPIYVGNNILGQFGLMGRIGKSVRSKSGLAYTASSAISGWTDVGTWEFFAGVNPENVDKTIQLIRDEIHDYVHNPVADKELTNTQSHLVGRMPMALESNAGLANAILTMQRFNLGFDYYQKYAERISMVTTDQILNASSKYLHPDRLVIASAGPGSAIE